MRSSLLCTIILLTALPASAVVWVPIDRKAVTHASDGAQDKTVPQESISVDALPKLLSRAEPVYPREALRQGIEGKVYVQVLVERDGSVAEVIVLKSDADVLNQSALDAARKFKFAPAMKDKSPIAARVMIPFQFRLSSGEKDPPPAELYVLLDLVEKLLKGPSDSSALHAVDPAATVILQNKLANLRTELMSGSSLRDAGTRSVYKQLYAEEPVQTATLFVITEGKAKRYHTVTFTRGRDRQWRIRLWHVSD
jgi:TonB family protein